MNYKLLFKIAMLAGEIMAQSGAETFRVEDTMIRILRISNFTTIDVYATTTGIVATLADSSTETITGVKRISNRSNNLSRINEVNQISRNLCEHCMQLEEAYEKLLNIRSRTTYSKATVAVVTILSAGGFVGLFGGNALDFIIAMMNGVFIVLLDRLAEKRIGNAFMMDIIKSFTIAFLTLLSTRLFSTVNQELIIIGSIMPLVPGIPITNAVRDTLQGNYMSGTSRAVEAFVISLGIAVGVGFGMGFFDFLERMLT